MPACKLSDSATTLVLPPSCNSLYIGSYIISGLYTSYKYHPTVAEWGEVPKQYHSMQFCSKILCDIKTQVQMKQGGRTCPIFHIRVMKAITNSEHMSTVHEYLPDKRCKLGSSLYNTYKPHALIFPDHGSAPETEFGFRR